MPRLRTLAVLIVLLAAPANRRSRCRAISIPVSTGTGRRSWSASTSTMPRRCWCRRTARSWSWLSQQRPFDFVVARLNPDGSLDNGFDGDGVTRADFGDPNRPRAPPYSRTAGCVAGYTLQSTSRDVAVARFNPNGSWTRASTPAVPTARARGSSTTAAATRRRPWWCSRTARLVWGTTTMGNDIAVARLEGDPSPAGRGGPGGRGGGPGSQVPTLPAGGRRSWAPVAATGCAAHDASTSSPLSAATTACWPPGATTACAAGPARTGWPAALKRPAARRPRGRPALRGQGERPAARRPRRGPPPRRRRPRHMPRRRGTRPRPLRDRAEHVTERVPKRWGPHG